MKLKIITLLLIITSYNLNSQNQIIRLKEFYTGEGVIINDFKEFPFLFGTINTTSKKYDVKLEEAEEVEKLISKEFYNNEFRLLLHFNYSTKNIEKYKNPKNVIKHFSKYNRQYAGFINQENDTIIYVGMLNFAKKNKAKKYFDGWKDSLVLGHGDWYYSNQKFFLYNKTKHRLEDLY